MPNLGAHVSVAGGLYKAFERAEATTCRAIQIFAKNERQWHARPLTEEEIALFRAEQRRTGLGPVLVHDSYLINLASPKDDLWQKSMNAFAEELERCRQLGIPYLVTHPGAHTGSGEEEGLIRESQALNRLFAEGIGEGVTVLLETTAGQGTCLGYRFEHLARLIELSDYPERLGICVDTCHIHAAGYDIRSREDYEQVFAELDRIIGLDRVKAFHLNDSKAGLGSRVDRHEHIGEGMLGIEAFRLLVNDPRFSTVPMVLETPKGKEGLEDIRNLALLRRLRQQPDEQPNEQSAGIAERYQEPAC
ncbi:MAG: putative endonuclease 4 [Herpetosiphonaceae bacterium]|nr:MAG: putative endonuclease 4 [Herpetosiphonaceae bacterium]